MPICFRTGHHDRKRKVINKGTERHNKTPRLSTVKTVSTLSLSALENRKIQASERLVP
jgi:hypothetical protein